MLTLSRREGESFILYTTDGEIVITFDEMKGNQAKISVDAPDDVDILRSELVEDDYQDGCAGVGTTVLSSLNCQGMHYR